MTPYYTSSQKDSEGRPRAVLYYGDCLDVLPTLDPDAFGVLLIDPPYGIAYNSGGRRRNLARSIAGDQDTGLRDAVLEWWTPRPALVFGSWKMPHPADTHTRLIWDTLGALGMGNLSVPWKPSDQEIYVMGYGFSGRRTNNVLRFPPLQSHADRKNGRHHPHQKPAALLEYLLSKCPPGTVLDTFAGVGSVAVSAAQKGRNSVSVEVDERYCEIAAKRIDAALSAPSMFAPAPPPPAETADLFEAA